MTDTSFTINDAKNLVNKFCSERDWDQFHTPKELAIGIVTESSELLELFRFKNEEDCRNLLSSDKREHIQEEIADIFYFILRFCQMNDIDLSEALIDKINKNNKKYPVEKFRGSNKKYSD